MHLRPKFSKLIIIFLLLCLAQVKAQDTLVVLKSITIQGIKVTKPQTIFREMNIAEGDKLPAHKVDAIMERNRFNVYNLGIFNDVDFNYVIDKDEVYLIILVRERWYIEPVVHLAVEERTFGEWWEQRDLDRIIIGGGVNWKNLTGYNDQFYLYVQEGYTRVLQTSFRRPFIFPKAMIDLNVHYQYSENKEIIYSTNDSGIPLMARMPAGPIRYVQSGGIDLTKRFNPLNRLTFSMGYQYYHPNDTVFRLNPDYLSSGVQQAYYPLLRLSFVRDYRDWKAFPLKGYKLFTSIEQNGLGFLSTTSFFQIQATWNQYLPISRRWNFAWATWHYSTIGRDIPFYDKHFIGTGNFLRGFERYVIDATSMHVLQSEIRFALIPRQIVRFPLLKSRRPEKDLLRKFRDFPIAVYLVAFADAGYIRDDAFNRTFNHLKNRALGGYGVGINLLTLYDHFLRIEISRNNYDQKYGFFLSGRIAIR
jgi:outer membrane protein assembly factor BamA